MRMPVRALAIAARVLALPTTVTLGGLGLGLAASSVVLSTDAVAEGKSAHESPYGYERTWNATLRFVRIDLGMKVLESDHANGFLLFEYRSAEGSQKATNGSFELIRAGGDSVHIVVQLSQMPRYHEERLLAKLGQKMREDYGEPPEVRPPPPTPAPPPTPGPDAGTGDGNESNDETTPESN
jgi:hypothetical protein